ncbi:MAG: mucoidy inhibitor MuiA family protein [Flavobacterium sp.]|nr:MAG: mucoidy inhibitor MuiA family protein [Flavobacterium sp.]
MNKSILFIVLLASAFANAQKPIFTTAKVKAATVYFNAAEISQTASVTLPLGTSEIVIKNVAVGVNESSVQIGAPANVTVLSVQFTNNYISEYEIDTKSPALKKVRDSITLVQKEIQRISNAINSESKTITLLDQNQIVAGSNSGLNVTELMKMVDYYKNKQLEIANSINTLSEKNQKLNEILQKLNNKLQVDTSKEEKTSSGKLIVQVMNDAAGIVPLDISYLTNSASWNPFYELRAESVTSPINMMYKAQVAQSTGIDWKKVKLTLSSGYPNQNNQAPILSTWFLRNNIAQNGYGYNQNSKMNQIQAAQERVSDEVITTGLGSMKKKSSVSDYTTVAENQLNISFDIDLPYDILSNGKIHSVSLKEIKLPASYKYYAAPKVEKEAFLLAEIADYSKYNLLKGEANIIFEGMYVGKTFIEPNQTSDTLNLSMGRDKKVSIKREKVADKSGTKFLSAKKEQTFTYDITVRNNKKENVELLLKDQYPLSTDKEIEVELLQSDSAKINSETGILTWQLQLKPNETKKIRFSYRVKYPKDQNLNL